jgi:hypothetical protein
MADNSTKNNTATSALLVAPQAIAKNNFEEVRLAATTYKGKPRLDCRTWYRPRDSDADDELKASREGWSLPLEKLPEVVASLQRLLESAKAAGVLAQAEGAE